MSGKSGKHSGTVPLKKWQNEWQTLCKEVKKLLKRLVALRFASSSKEKRWGKVFNQIVA